jgi:predicted RNA-binding protein with PIN domain
VSEPRLILIDGYNLVHRSGDLRPGPDRTLRQAREKLVNLLSWAVGGDVRFVIVFDGSGEHGRDESSGRIEVRYSKPPEKADDLIRRLVERHVGGDRRVTVVTADLEVARHARAMGADVSISDLFMASLLGPGRTGVEPSGGGEKPPANLTKKEIEEWAEIFRRGKPAAEAPDEKRREE